VADGRSLEQRVRELEDRVELTELVHAYNLATDDRDWEAFTELFAPDARLGPYRGRDEVVRVLREMREEHGRTRHIAHGHVVEFTGPDEASGTVMATSELDMHGTAHAVALRYLDRYVRVDGRWRFVRRKVLFLYVIPVADLREAMTSPEPVRWPGRERAAADI
jgi:uncharacterized protein (TIGR02246 family)